MIITCPRCSTRYTMSATVLGVDGRVVRCSNCGTEWHQDANQEDTRAARPVPPPRWEPERTGGYAYPPPPQGGYYGAPQQAPRGYPNYPPAPPPPPPEPAPIAESFAPRPAPVEPDVVRAPEPPKARETAMAPAAPEKQLSEQEIEQMFGADPEPMTSFVGETDRPDREEAVSPDEIPDPEPMPEVYAPFRPRGEGDEDEDSKGGRWAVALGFLLLFLMAVAGGAFFGKDIIISYLPEAAQIYKDFGLYREQPGAGLEVRVAQTDPINNGEGMNITGVVSNITDKVRPVPLIKVLFLNGEGVEVQSMLVKPAKTDLPAAEQIGFQARIDRLTPTARKLVVTFTTPELEANTNPKGPKG